MSEGAKTPESGTLQTVPKTGALSGPTFGTVTPIGDAPESAPSHRVGEGFDEASGLDRTAIYVRNLDSHAATVTERVVPRDTSGTDPGQSRVTSVNIALVTRDTVVTPCEQGGPSMTLEDLHERERESQYWSWMSVANLQERARLDGRHGRTWWEATAFIWMKRYTVAEVASIRAAFDEGVNLRHRNVRCFCNSCINPSKIVENERKRGLYAQRRREELTAEGVAPAEVEKRILEEIDKGMAL